MSTPLTTHVTYRSGTHPAQGWDVIQVIYQNKDATTNPKRIANSFTIARAADGTILWKTDILLERWETVTDANDLPLE